MNDKEAEEFIKFVHELCASTEEKISLLVEHVGVQFDEALDMLGY
jgi:hypothetical protein